MRQLLAVPLFVLAAQAASSPAPGATPAPAGLADVAFMSGHWLGGEGGDLSEEVWTAPEGDSMVGLWRYVSKGQVRILELLSIRVEADGVAMRLRHFDPSLVAREDKDRPLVLRLVRRAPGEAVFEGPAGDGSGAVRLGYRREGDEGLVGLLEKAGQREEFRFRRAPRP
jgi:hypothetical protein